MKTCLVLGAGGFIGKNLCFRLARDCRVIAYDRYICDEFEGNRNIESVKGDFIAEQNFDPMLRGVDVVYHLIGTTLPSDRIDNAAREAEENIIPTLRLLTKMAEHGGMRLIYASSGGTVYGERHGEVCFVEDRLRPQCTYAVQKQVIENYLDFYDRCTDLDCIAARLANPYGMGQDTNRRQGVIPIFVYNLLTGQPVSMVGDGTDRRDYIHMDDVTSALEKLAFYEGETRTFNIGSGKNYSLLEVMEMIERNSGERFADVRRLPARKFDVSSVALDITQTMAELGWKPEIDLESGIRGIIKRYRELV